ncbi:MAG TPA: hypothetical protein VFT22_20580 [Kofleriaceae bacterium]|nr:hypothetical protein [Kofleriaceae bacterium]
MKKLAIQGTCLCTAVQVGAARVPRQVTQCNCSVCRSYGTLWAYYRRSAVSITAPRGALEDYSRRPGGLRFVRCRSCGCVICWEPRGKGPGLRMGVNARLFDHALMADVPVKVLDGDKTWRPVDTYVKPEMWVSPARERARPAEPRPARRPRR